MHTLLSRSMDEKLKLEMIYMTKQGDLSQRVIRVIKIDNYKVLAYCFMKREVRMFTIENILSIYPYQHKRHIGA